jgi:quinol monooxygenase YgiN
MPPVIIVSNLTPVDDIAVEPMLAVLAKWVPIMQRRPGCQLYAISRGRGRARGRYLLLERWVDDEAFHGYGKSTELHGLHEEIEPYVESLEDFFVYAPVRLREPADGTPL